MRRWLVVAALLGACATPSIQPQTFLAGTFEVEPRFRTPDLPLEETDYVIWFSREPSEQRPLPLVVFLHGSGDDDYDTDWVLSYGLPQAIASGKAADLDAAVLIPQAAPASAWWSGRQIEVVDALVSQMLDRYELRSDSVAATGLSMGGYGVWHLAAAHPDRYRRILSVSGSGFGSADIPDGVDACALGGVQVRAIHGSEDPIALPPAIAESLDRIERRCGTDLALEIVEGEGHFGTFERAYRDPDVLGWLTG